jgi:uncharacterized protein
MGGSTAEHVPAVHGHHAAGIPEHEGEHGSLFWERVDGPGAEQAFVAASPGLLASGTCLAGGAVPYTARYMVRTEDWVTTEVAVETRGAGWVRTVELVAEGTRWRVSAATEGDLDAALGHAGLAGVGAPGCADVDSLVGAFDVEIVGSALTSVLPVRRLELLDGEPGVAHRVSVVSVRLPGLVVAREDRICTLLEDGRVRFAGETETVDISVDADGFAIDRPGLARRVEG